MVVYLSNEIAYNKNCGCLPQLLISELSKILN